MPWISAWRGGMPMHLRSGSQKLNSVEQLININSHLFLGQTETTDTWHIHFQIHTSKNHVTSSFIIVTSEWQTTQLNYWLLNTGYVPCGVSEGSTKTGFRTSYRNGKKRDIRIWSCGQKLITNKGPIGDDLVNLCSSRTF